MVNSASFNRWCLMNFLTWLPISGETLMLICLGSPIAAFAYGQIKACKCEGWPRSWRVVVLLAYLAALLFLLAFNTIVPMYLNWGLGWFVAFLGYGAIVVMSFLGPAFATAFVLNAIDAHQASQRNLCRYCQYNLTGNISGVCPECGEQIEPLEELMGDEQ